MTDHIVDADKKVCTDCQPAEQIICSACGKPRPGTKTRCPACGDEYFWRDAQEATDGSS